MTTTKEKGRIARTGAGGFLNPPGHPEHTLSIETDLRRPENRSSMSLSSAVDSDWLDDSTRAAAKEALDAWEVAKLPLESDEVQAWVLQVLGYFRNCYKGTDDGKYRRGSWAAESLNIDPDRDPLEHVDEHAGVHLIRRYYSDFTPTAEHFANARWGA